MQKRKPPKNSEITQLLKEWQSGDKEAENQLMILLQRDLKQIIRSTRRKQDRGGEERQTTELLNELYIELAGTKDEVSWENRSMFFGFAAHLMRRILITEYRHRMAQKRGSGLEDLPLDAELITFKDQPLDLEILDQALNDLAKIDERKSKIVEMRFFAGLTIEESAQCLDLSPASVKRHWQTAQAWLYQYLSGENPPGS